jgi:hypothetical protein
LQSLTSSMSPMPPAPQIYQPMHHDHDHHHHHQPASTAQIQSRNTSPPTHTVHASANSEPQQLSKHVNESGPPDSHMPCTRDSNMAESNGMRDASSQVEVTLDAPSQQEATTYQDKPTRDASSQCTDTSTEHKYKHKHTNTNTNTQVAACTQSHFLCTAQQCVSNYL